MRSFGQIKVRQLGDAGGAEIIGIDLARPLGQEALAEIRAAIGEFLVVTFPDQVLDDSGLAAFTEQLGPFGIEPFVEGQPTHPNVIAVIKEADETNRYNFGGSWHTDWSFLPRPPRYTLLHAREIPPAGGDTLFANQHLAFESLSPGMKHMLCGLRAVHSAKRTLSPASVLSDPNYLRSMKVRTGPQAFVEHVQPVVRVHPDTNRPALYVNRVYTNYFERMTETESAPLLNFLCEHAVRPEFVVRVQWRLNMLTIWDNRAVLHMAMNDYDGYRRDMRRTTVMGEAPQPFALSDV